MIRSYLKMIQFHLNLSGCRCRSLQCRPSVLVMALPALQGRLAMIRSYLKMIQFHLNVPGWPLSGVGWHWRALQGLLEVIQRVCQSFSEVCRSFGGVCRSFGGACQSFGAE